jgi:hypothetical protein
MKPEVSAVKAGSNCLTLHFILSYKLSIRITGIHVGSCVNRSMRLLSVQEKQECQEWCRDACVGQTS